jgi:transposase-like protein
MKQLNKETEKQVNKETESTSKRETSLDEETKKVVNDETLSKSKRIIALYQLGYSVKQVSELMGIRYNFAYNILSNFTRLNNLDLGTRRNTDTKKQRIIEMVSQGMSNTEISKVTQTNYNYVYKIAKEWINQGNSVVVK